MATWHVGTLTVDQGVAAVAAAVVTTVLGALIAYILKVRGDAWFHVYKEKRDEIRQFVAMLDDFAQRVLLVGQVIEAATFPLDRKAGRIMRVLGERWGRDRARWTDMIPQLVHQLLPPPQLLQQNPKAAGPMIEQARVLLYNGLMDDLVQLNLLIGTRRTTLTLTLRDPRVTESAQDLLNASAVRLETGANTQPPAFDANDYSEWWARSVSPIKLALRKDLNKSAKGLGRCTRLTFAFRLYYWKMRRRRRRTMNAGK